MGYSHCLHYRQRLTTLLNSWHVVCYGGMLRKGNEPHCCALFFCMCKVYLLEHHVESMHTYPLISRKEREQKHPGVVWLLMTLINFVLKDIKHFQIIHCITRT